MANRIRIDARIAEDHALSALSTFNFFGAEAGRATLELNGRRVRIGFPYLDADLRSPNKINKTWWSGNDEPELRRLLEQTAEAYGIPATIELSWKPPVKRVRKSGFYATYHAKSIESAEIIHKALSALVGTLQIVEPIGRDVYWALTESQKNRVGQWAQRGKTIAFNIKQVKLEETIGRLGAAFPQAKITTGPVREGSRITMQFPDTLSARRVHWAFKHHLILSDGIMQVYNDL